MAGGVILTVNLLERQRTLLTDPIDLLRDSVRRVKRLYPVHIDAWVVLPDHLHSTTTWMGGAPTVGALGDAGAVAECVDVCRPKLTIFRCVDGYQDSG